MIKEIGTRAQEIEALVGHRVFLEPSVKRSRAGAATSACWSGWGFDAVPPACPRGGCGAPVRGSAIAITGSLRDPGLLPPRGPGLDPVTLSSYEWAFELVDLGRYTANSLLVAAISIPLRGARRLAGGLRDLAAAAARVACRPRACSWR